MGKRAGETAGQDTATRKRKRKSTDDATGAAICDDVVDDIFARLPTRAAVASMVLSKHHRRLICSPEFRSLHFRLSPPAPLPHPHIAYVATVSTFHSFHVAGGGIKSSNSPMRTLPDERYFEMKYVNTCNGVVLLAGPSKPPTTCVLWNPAVADDEKKVTIPTVDTSHYQSQLWPYESPGDYRVSILGLVYGRRTKAYKLLLLLWEKPRVIRISAHPILAYCKELLVYTLGTVGEQPRRVTLLEQGLYGGINQDTLYINGTIYFPFGNSEILAFNVDDEEVTRIDEPGSKSNRFQNPAPFELVEMSNRPCLVKNNGRNVSLWLLTEDHMWEQRCVFKVDKYLSYPQTRVVWNCSGALVLYLYDYYGDVNLFSYDVATKKLLKENLSYHSMPEVSDYALCWGYMPTLVSPGSIVGELSPDEDGRCSRIRMVGISGKPDNEQDRKNWQMTALNTIRFMESLIPILEKLSKTQDAV